MRNIELRLVTDEDAAWIQAMILAEWHADYVITGGRLIYPHRLPGFVAMLDSAPVGLVTYLIDGADCEIITLNSMLERNGIGEAMVHAVEHAARTVGCTTLRLLTTNDNLNALRFYQKRGFALAAIHRNAVSEARRTKPSIPLIGHNGIPLRDEIELVMVLPQAPPPLPN